MIRHLDLERVGHLLDVGRAGRRRSTRCALYVGIRSTRHCGRQSSSQQPTRWVGWYSATSRVMMSSNPRTALTGVPSAALHLSGTPKNARKYSEAESSSIRRSVTREPATCHARRSRGVWRRERRQVEDIDRKIVELLATDGRMSLHRPRQGHRPVHVGRAPAREAAGAARHHQGYAATIDHTALDLPLTAFISIRPIDPSAARRLARAAARGAARSSRATRSPATSPTSSRSGSPPLPRSRTCSPHPGRQRLHPHDVVLTTPYESRPVT